MNLREVKEKQKNISYFLQFVEISKISILKDINLETKRLSNIFNLKKTNLLFLNKLNENFPYLDIFHQKKQGKNDKKKTLYILVDPKEINTISEISLKKLEILVKERITKDDYVITYGNSSKKMCQKLELNSIENFDYEDYLNADKFTEIINSIVQQGLANNIFNESQLILSNTDLASAKLLENTLFPFGQKSIDEKLGFEVEEENDISVSSTPTETYTKLYNNLNVKDIQWIPNITYSINEIQNLVIKQIIYEMRVRSKIDDLRIELKLLDEKKKKLLEKQEIIIRHWNRLRKEESTNQVLLLNSAFKIAKKDPLPPLYKEEELRGRR